MEQIQLGVADRKLLSLMRGTVAAGMGEVKTCLRADTHRQIGGGFFGLLSTDPAVGGGGIGPLPTAGSVNYERRGGLMRKTGEVGWNQVERGHVPSLIFTWKIEGPVSKRLVFSSSLSLRAEGLP